MNSGIYGLTFVACIALASVAAQAHGILAMGIPGNIADDGFAIGVSENEPTREEAERKAKELCFGFKEVEPRVRNLCEAIVDFTGKCVSVAYDPEPGTYGLGWAMGDTQEEADAGAMARCKARSKVERVGYCQVDTGSQSCDSGI